MMSSILRAVPLAGADQSFNCTTAWNCPCDRPEPSRYGSVPVEALAPRDGPSSGQSLSVPSSDLRFIAVNLSWSLRCRDPQTGNTLRLVGGGYQWEDSNLVISGDLYRAKFLAVFGLVLPVHSNQR